MLTDKKSLPNSRIKLSIIATAAQFRHAFEHELTRIGKDVNLPGFRPGKAPKAKILEKVGRQSVEAGAIDHAISDAYFDVVQAENMIPVANPEINLEKYEAPSDADADDKAVITFTAEVDIMPQVEIKDYKKIRLASNNQAPEVPEDEVEKVLVYLQSQKAELKELAVDVSLEKGMWADLGYEGSVDGVSRTDMKNEHHPLVIGEGQLVPGFEEQLTGMKSGEERTITVTFPKEYHAKELANKKAEFVVKLHELKEVELPARDAEFAKEYGHDSFDKLYQAIKENLHEEKQQESKQKMEEEVIDKLLEVATFETPQSLVETELDRMFKDAQTRLQGMNFNWETYLAQVKKTEKEVKEEMRVQAEKNVRVGLALGKIIQEEGLQEGENAGRIAIDRLLEIAKG